MEANEITSFSARKTYNVNLCKFFKSACAGILYGYLMQHYKGETLQLDEYEILKETGLSESELIIAKQYLKLSKALINYSDKGMFALENPETYFATVLKK